MRSAMCEIRREILTVSFEPLSRVKTCPSPSAAVVRWCPEVSGELGHWDPPISQVLPAVQSKKVTPLYIYTPLIPRIQ
jgi:hypothetical protein